MLQLADKTTTFKISSTDASLGFEGNVVIDENNAISSINGTFKENDENVGNIYYSVKDGKANKNINNLDVAAEGRIDSMFSTILTELSEQIK